MEDDVILCPKSWKLIHEEVIPPKDGCSVVVKKGQRLSGGSIRVHFKIGGAL